MPSSVIFRIEDIATDIEEAQVIDQDVSRRTRWEKAAEWPLTVAAILFLAAYAYPIVNPELSQAAHTWANRVEWGTWALFGLDYLVRLILTERRWAWVRHNLFDLAVVALPILRPLRLLRLVTMLSTMNRYAGSSLRGRVVIYLVGGSFLIVFVGALAMLDQERGQPEANIETFGDAVWWALTTVTTVGYGDQYPVTGTGRFIAAGVMVAGIALLGTVTATLASWLIESVREEAHAGVSGQ